jgi:hypothetical protein
MARTCKPIRVRVNTVNSAPALFTGWSLNEPVASELMTTQATFPLIVTLMGRWIDVTAFANLMSAARWCGRLARNDRDGRHRSHGRRPHETSLRRTPCASRTKPLSAWLSLTTLPGLSLNASFGWWWADPVVALAMLPLIVREGLEAWHGD